MYSKMKQISIRDFDLLYMYIGFYNVQKQNIHARSASYNNYKVHNNTARKYLNFYPIFYRLYLEYLISQLFFVCWE